MERKWTPGPWSIGCSADHTPLICAPTHESEGSGFGVAHINRVPRMGSVRGDMNANATLISAAPDLVEALEGARKELAYITMALDADTPSDEIGYELAEREDKLKDAENAARTALAKAKGEAQ